MRAMNHFNLKKLISKRGEPAFALVAMLQRLDPTIVIQDAERRVLVGADSAAPQYAIEAQAQVVGWVKGETFGAELAFLLTQVIAQAAEKKALAHEVLGLYREINLLYNLSEKLGASLELGAVAQTGLDEAHSLIQATSGAVVLTTQDPSRFRPAAWLGDATQTQDQIDSIAEILRHVIETGKAEIINYVRLDPRYVKQGAPVSALLCAPLRANGQPIGALALMSAVILTYTAAELKLINTLAALVGPAIASALLYEKSLREAKEREEKLQRQIDQLKVELDHALVAKQVSQITESDYFQQLSQRAQQLRRPAGGAPGRSADTQPGK